MRFIKIDATPMIIATVDWSIFLFIFAIALLVFSSGFSYTVYTGTAMPSNPERNINHVTSFTSRIGFIFFGKYMSSENTILRFTAK